MLFHVVGAMLTGLAATVAIVWHQRSESLRYAKANARSIPDRCLICERPLDVPGDPLSVDCGGDCLGCVRRFER